ncbi:MAG: CRISPR-associated helicase Cas3' [Nitrospirae bacterium]|nr:CRISPR-associated helicase Cas3' [Nitrospirota bacterium]
MTHFWAKTTSDDNPGISVYEHMLNVGCVARCISDINPSLIERFQLRTNVVASLAALHDIGKIAPGFQRKCPAWINENNLSEIDRKFRWDVMERDHGKISHATIQDFLSKIGVSSESAQYLAAILGAHHGRIKYYPNPRGYRIGTISENDSGIDWESERQKCAEQLWNVLKGENADALTEESPAIWWLAGLTSVADWIGSDERFFSPVRRSGEEDKDALARNALESIGFRKVEIIQNLSFHDLFHEKEKPDSLWIPNDMQKKTIAMVGGPGVYVLEAPMGMGKTEAALWAAYNLMSAGKAIGIYFALPTQATSNRMHLRMNEFVERIAPNANASRLIHGNSWLKDKTVALEPAASSDDNEEGDARAGRDWFSSAKRALIAPFGVGTIDQALLGVVAAKHFFVRHFALAGKVVILDEVHSYDLYTGTLIDKLITTLEGLGCTVIVLSATLTGKRLGAIVSLPDDMSGNDHLPYPLITGRYEGLELAPVTAEQPNSLKIKVDFISKPRASEEAIMLARKGGSVLWVCNTVDEAQKQYRAFKELVKEDIPVGLLHSRFPFWRREEIEDEWMKRFGKSGETRGRSILVSTQIVEQSVDLDADLMITELAPTDMLLQRLGRLWRHDRGQRRPVDTARLCIIKEEKSLDEFRDMKPKEIKAALGSKSNVYAPYALLRTLEIWEAIPQTEGNQTRIIEIPLQIRTLIESTYKDRDAPPSWQELYNEWFGTDSAKKMQAQMNTNIWQLALEDTEGNQTRINERPTISVVLCKNIQKNKALFIDNTQADIGGDSFILKTAQAIHSNIVKVPEYCFEKERMKPCLAFKEYIFDRYSAAIVDVAGVVEVSGLKSDVRLFYTDKMGLVIEGKSGKEGV